MIYEHVGMIVSDINKSIDFYTQSFGFNLLKKTNFNAYLYKGNDMLELMQCEHTVDKKEPTPPLDSGLLLSGPPGVIHIGFRVDDLDEAIKRLNRHGGKMVRPPEKFSPTYEYTADVTDEKLKRAIKPKEKSFMRIAVFVDPDGILLELLER
jgi:catechol 2,3-dioxygenase-like lactoylglutathione lyase family enzyme